MTALLQLLGRLVDMLFLPLRGLPPLASLAVISLVVAVLMLLVFRATSDQQRVAAAKRQMQAGLFEIRLFNDDLRAILRAQGDILRHNLTYLRLSLVPMLWMLVPLVLAVAQLQSYYGYRAFAPGETFLLKVRLQEGSGSARPDVQLRLPGGLRAETPEVWIPSLAELAWRLRAERPGRYAVQVQLASTSFDKEVRVAGGFERLSPVRQRPGLRAQLLYPSESPLPESLLQSIHVTYPTRDISLFSWRLPWMVVFVLLVLAFALLLKDRFRVSL